ncbi:hypothetical protein KFE25_002999 [Diacronema lutheri]|uniref:Uncharacterized protein n=1 Tax=Diacronema lutheri TaxID=2081491 RepID=A0A8J5XPB0_DIALT|nr:hypothetical protein KFE25_002999 [Diacronema lutheri]
MPRASREALFDDVSPGLRSKLQGNPLVRRLLLAHGLRFGFSTTARHQRSGEANDGTTKRRRVCERERLAAIAEEGPPASLGTLGDLAASSNSALRAAHNAAQRTLGPVLRACEIVAQALPVPPLLRRVADWRVERAGSKPAALRQFHTLVRTWHQDARPLARRVRELGLLRALLIALIDAPEHARHEAPTGVRLSADAAPTRVSDSTAAQHRDAALSLLQLHAEL